MKTARQRGAGILFNNLHAPIKNTHVRTFSTWMGANQNEVVPGNGVQSLAEFAMPLRSQFDRFKPNKKVAHGVRSLVNI